MTKRTRTKLSLLCMLVVSLLVMPCASYANAPAERAAKQTDLQQKNEKLGEAKARLDTLEKGVDALKADRAKLNAALIKTGARVQKTEAALIKLEAKLAALSTERDDLRTRLSAENQSITTLLGAMQRMGRDPPPVIFTERSDALRMVRSAMLLAKAFPELKDRADELVTKIRRLNVVLKTHEQESRRLKAEEERLKAEQAQLADLMETKRRTLLAQRKEMLVLQQTTQKLSRDVTNIQDLLKKLDKTIEEQTALGAYNARVRAEEADARQKLALNATPTPPADPNRLGQSPENALKPTQPPAHLPNTQRLNAPTQPGAAASPPQEPTRPVTRPVVPLPPVANLPPPERRPSVLPPAARLPRPDPTAKPAENTIALVPVPGGGKIVNSGRLEPARPFYKMKGQLQMPAAGTTLVQFGDRTNYEGRAKGLVIETRSGALITSPSDGWVEYAGEYRSYGKILIINAGTGYHVLLAGLSRIDVAPGRFVVASEPVGTMLRQTKQTPQSKPPALYVEFRKNGQAIDPGPWWEKGQQKVQG